LRGCSEAEAGSWGGPRAGPGRGPRVGSGGGLRADLGGGSEVKVDLNVGAGAEGIVYNLYLVRNSDLREMSTHIMFYKSK
jgi:hypothetical protein